MSRALMGLKKYKFGLALFAALLLPQVVTNTYFVTMFCLARSISSSPSG